MRLPFLRPKDDPAAARARAAASAGVDDTVQSARRRARQRLVGALVLLAVGVIGFPVLFETQPRPLPLDTPIDVNRGAGHASGSVTSTAPPSLPAVTRAPVLPPTDAGIETAPGNSAPGNSASAPAGIAALAAAASAPRTGAQMAGAPASAVQAVAKAAAADAAAKESSAQAAAKGPSAQPTAKQPDAAAKVAATTPAKAASGARADDAKRASSLLAGAPAAAASVGAGPASAAGATRFIVQAGAYGDAAGLREARQTVEKLGLKTYTQVVQTDTGKRTRVRVGPFDTRKEAEAVAARVKAAGLPVAVLTL